jgi:uncharacterized protein (TIGR02594 family)
MASVRDIQTALGNKSFNPGGVDGIWGRNTIKAVRAFQSANGLTVDGIVGANTLAKLFGASAPVSGGGGTVAPAPAAAPMVWYEEAKRLFGLREGQGARDNPTIIDWADQLGIDYDHDDIAWCGLFVAHCIGATLTDEPLPANPLGARNWARFGETATEALGAILVFWRESPNSGKGHVGFYHGQDDGAYHVLGGNQSDSVSITRVAKNRLLAIRRPSTPGPLAGGPVLVKADSALSLNEA